jgi:2-polyprenyl-6-methoxyphenol hydroxylase-like FAD-dependent oxidoreductase
MRMLALRDDGKISGKPEVDVERRAAHRLEFRRLLLDGIPQHGKIVHWGKEFTHYKSLLSGQVRAHFADSTYAEGDVLIASDGAKSKVREQRLPAVQREDLGIVIICGRYQLDEERAKALPGFMTDGSLNNIVPYEQGWLFIASFPGLEDERGPRENYTLWAYVVPKSQTPTNAEDFSPE